MKLKDMAPIIAVTTRIITFQKLISGTIYYHLVRNLIRWKDFFTTEPFLELFIATVINCYQMTDYM